MTQLLNSQPVDDKVMNPVVGCHHFLPGLWVPLQRPSTTALWQVPIILLGDRGTCV